MRGKKDIIPAYNDPWKGEGRAGKGWKGWNAINHSWKCKGRMKHGVGGRGCPGMNRLKMRRLSRSVMKGLPKGCSRGSTEFPTCISCPLTSDPAARWSWCTHLQRRQPGVASPRSPFSTRAGKDISGDRDAPPFAASNSRWQTLQMRLSWQRGGCDEWLGLQVKAQHAGAWP